MKLDTAFKYTLETLNPIDGLKQKKKIVSLFVAFKICKSIKIFVSVKQYSFPHCVIVMIRFISRDRKPTNLS